VITGVANSTTTARKSRIAAAGLLYRATDWMIARPVIRCLGAPGLEASIARRWHLYLVAVDRHAVPDDVDQAVSPIVRPRAI